LGCGTGFDHLLLVVVVGDFHFLIRYEQTNQKFNRREKEKRLQGIDEELSEEIARFGASES